MSALVENSASNESKVSFSPEQEEEVVASPNKKKTYSNDTFSDIKKDFKAFINEMRASDFQNSSQYDNMLTFVENSSFSDVIKILDSETKENATLRLENEYPLAQDLIILQQKDIELCFHEVNYLRAELAELCADHTKYTIEKFYIARYINGSMKETASQKQYAAHTMKTTLENRLSNSTFSEASFKSRIHNDLRIKQHYKGVLLDTSLSYTLKKKYEWEYSRSKAILKADIKAFKAAWPNADYVFLAFIDAL
jgi:hypothetical protein